ncbi:MAG: hypothetical protein FWF03_04380, partial [Defluviitaleaceae bacterium]|nr:hypothetical protein [Defluviitaleaceae bacterium]
LIGTGGRLELYTVEWDNPEKYSMKLLHYDESKGAQTERRFEPANPFVLEVEAYRRALGERKQINPDAADGFYVDAAIGAMFESSRKKKPVEIDWKGL